MSIKRIYFLLVLICLIQKINGQIRKDSVMVNDTLTVYSYKDNNHLEYEHKYLNKKLVSTKWWYYSDNGFGYIYTENKKEKNKIELRKEFNKDSSLKIEGILIRGKINGAYKTYYPNGQIECNCYYSKGKRDSIQVKYHANGQLNFIGFYRNGKQTGEQTDYYINGKIKNISFYKNGKQDGKSTFYFPNGNKWSELVYEKGKLINVLYNYDINGMPKDKGSLKDGNGTLYIYNEEGELTEIEHYKKGKLKHTEEQE